MGKFILYEKARETNKIVKSFLNYSKLKYIYKDQLDRAITGMVLNIAEGGGRNTIKDKRRFFVMARGSAEECVAIFDMLEDENLLSKSDAAIYRGRLYEIIKISSALILKED